MGIKKQKFILFKHIQIALIAGGLLPGCAGTVFNPYLEDMYGVKKHMVNDVVVLLDVKKIPEEENTFEFKFYEPVLAADPVRKRARERTISAYYNEFRDRNSLGREYHNIRAVRNTNTELEYYYIITYSDSSKVDHEKIIEPGLIPFDTLLKPDL